MSESGGDLASLRAEVDRLRTLVEAQQAALDGLARRLGVNIATEAGDSEDDQLWRRLGLTEGERRIVTILFADVSGFTALGERLDPEEVQLVMRDTMGGLARCVQAEAGHVEKFIGDAVCAIFGAPMAHEDEPERAVRTALAMHATVADLARRRPDLPALAVHIGLNTGIVVAGAVGDGSQFGVMGDATNTANRVMGLAEPGQTLVSADTARRVRRRFRLIDRGQHRVKGKSQPLAVFEVAGPADEAMKSTGLHAPFVGRTHEQQLLEEVLASTAEQGGGRLVVVTGEAGIGKTRLVDEVIARSTAGWRVLRAEARLAGDHPRALVLGALAPVLDEAGPVDDRSLVDSVRSEAARRAVLVAVDDADRADEGTLELIGTLAEATRDRPVAWLVVGRRLPSGLAGKADPSIRLEPLAAADTAALFDGLLPGALAPDQAARLAHRAGGNPTFAEEIAHALIDESIAVMLEDESYRLAGDPDHVPIPGTVTELVEARIDALDSVARVALQEASVVGVRFRRRLLEAVATGPTSLDAALSELMTEELIEPPPDDDPDGLWTFRSEMIRDVAYHSVLRRRRLIAHRLVGEALLALEPDEVDANAELLAHHFEHSDHPERAIPHLERAVTHALEAGSPTDASAVARRAVAIARHHPAAVEVDLVERFDQVVSGRVGGEEQEDQERRR